jgi:2-methylcitrate dehydratase PrpD
MNGAFAAAVALLDGDAFLDQYEPERLSDPRVLEIMKRIHLRHDPALDAGGAAGRHAIRAEAALTQGRRLEVGIAHRLGSPENPIPPERLIGKFRRLAGERFAPSEIEGIIAAVEALEERGGLERLIGLLGRCSVSRESRASAIPSSRLR